MLRRVFASFTTDEILRESGRLPFGVLTPFVRSGYEVLVWAGLRDRLASVYGADGATPPETARLTACMPGVAFVDRLPEDPSNWVYLFDQELPGSARIPWRRRVRVRFDLFSPYRLREPLIAPYGMHPTQALLATSDRLCAWRSRPRSMRLLFAGDSKGYVRNRVRFPGPKLPRLEVLNTLKARLPDALTSVGGADEIERLCAAGFVDRFVLSESGSGITPQQWLPTLARADFFLCPPGIVMPMCHNLIEAMAVGTIPLIGYPEWLHPNLRHLENCVAFDDADDLVEKTQMVLAMPPERIARMRAAAIDYYEQHLRPERLVDAIEARPQRDLTVLIHTELNMARNAARLGPRSVLVRGANAGGPLRRLGRILDSVRGDSGEGFRS